MSARGPDIGELRHRSVDIAGSAGDVRRHRDAQLLLRIHDETGARAILAAGVMPARPLRLILVDAPAEPERRRTIGALGVEGEEDVERALRERTGREMRGAEAREIRGRG